MGDVNDAHALIPEHVDDPEQVLYFFFRQGGSGLVKYQYLGIIGNGLGDLHHLPLRNGHGAHDPPGVNVDLQLLEHLHGVFVHLLLIDHDPRNGGITAQPDVVHNRALQGLVQLLVYHGHAIVQGFPAALKVHFLTVQEDMTVVLFVNAEQALHKGGLSRAVFTHQGVDRSRLYFQGNMVQGLYAGEGLGDILHSQKNRFLHMCVPPLGQRMTERRDRCRPLGSSF